jgi:PAS domain S-box-containing protein
VEGENRFRYEEVNETYTKINGVEREKVVGRLVGEIMPSQNFEQLFTLFNKAITTGQTQKFVSVNTWFDGIRAFELASVPIKGESGSVDKILVIAKDISDQKKAEDALLKTNNELRELSSYLENVREEERKNMAREIHDELGQHLTGIKMEVSWIGRHLQTKDEKIETKIKSSLKLIDETINSVRRIATQLRPSILDDLGLAEALDWQSREFSTRTGLAVEFSSNVNEMIYPSAISSSVFRIFQEALTNITRHAKATKVSSRLEEIGEVLYLTVADNGVGFVIHQQAEGKTLGLLGMKERVAMLNGIYDVQSEPGEGTVISVQIPLA